MAVTEKGGAVARRGDTRLVPIPLATLRVDSVMNFDLFFRPAPSQPHVLYSESNIPFTEAARQRLVQAKVDTLFIRASERVKYAQYVQDSLTSIIADDKLPIEFKSELIYSSASGVMEEVLANPESYESIQLSKETVKNTVAFMLSKKGIFRHLLGALSLDYEVYSHSVNVVTYAVALARAAGHTDPATLRELSLGALLHDIGKCRIDASILNSADSLTDEQWVIMKRHPVHGHEILRRIGGLSEVSLDIVRHHHEKARGGGYPDDLQGDRLSRFVRIVTIADIFDALTTNRPFQEAQSSFQALTLMSAQVAQDLDPTLLRIFVKMMGNPS